MNPKFKIFGSCVTRDPFDSISSKITLVSYLSKTSVISQVSHGDPFPYPSPDGSDFSSRVVRQDIEKSALGELSKNDYDYLLIDFIDDRLPLYLIGNSFYTGSRFFENHFGESLKLSRNTLSVCSERGRFTFLESLEVFLKNLLDSGVAQEKIILHRAWWARAYQKGEQIVSFPLEKLKEIHLFNNFLCAAYKKFKEILPKSRHIECPKNLVLADSDHKWGVDPFHYVPEYNAEFCKLLLNIIEGDKTKAFEIKSYLTPVLKQNKRLVKSGGYENKGDKRNPICSEYGLDLPYLTHEKEFVAKFRDTGVDFDEKGVPWNKFRWGGPYRYSVTIGHHGLSELSRYIKNNDRAHLNSAISVANWLVENQAENGAWIVNFDHDWFPPRCQKIKAPWTSAMGQGLCISLLSRLTKILKSDNSGIQVELFINSARRAARPFSVDVLNGGVRGCLFDKHVFYEEYPTRPSSFVLNGFIYSILGLYDLWLLTGDEGVLNLYKEGINSLRACLPFYDLGRATSYDLTHLTCPGYPPNIARYSYHFIHVQLLSVLNIIEKGEFDVYVERWALYQNGWGDKGN